MAEHSISARIGHPIEIINKDLQIVVKRNGRTFGTLTISKGTIDWRPKKKWIGGKNETTLGWSRFDTVMREARR